LPGLVVGGRQGEKNVGKSSLRTSVLQDFFQVLMLKVKHLDPCCPKKKKKK
jgi:hypothetical protein